MAKNELFDGRREFDLEDLIESEGDYYLAIENMEEYIKELSQADAFQGNLVVSVVTETWQGQAGEKVLYVHETLPELWEAVLESYNDGDYDNLKMILEDKKLRFEFVHHDGRHRLYVRKEGQ
jgi:hypothetical protein